mmetsp:Transcript_16710/g.18100  ORF Transcript_16710/g.18100 Transcript_16710/m.18100 type:complete len:114 (+) Transcript_16710:161-502(+)|eukprot:gene3770-4028_t
MLVSILFLVVCLCISVNFNLAFAPSSSLGRVARANSALFSKRNTKEEKRIRNRINARKFGENGEERKTLVRDEKRQKIAEGEQIFIDKCFVVTNDEEYPEYHEFDEFFEEMLF